MLKSLKPLKSYLVEFHKEIQKTPPTELVSTAKIFKDKTVQLKEQLTLLKEQLTQYQENKNMEDLKKAIDEALAYTK